MGPTLGVYALPGKAILLGYLRPMQGEVRVPAGLDTLEVGSIALVCLEGLAGDRGSGAFCSRVAVGNARTGYGTRGAESGRKGAQKRDSWTLGYRGESDGEKMKVKAID